MYTLFTFSDGQIAVFLDLFSHQNLEDFKKKKKNEEGISSFGFAAVDGQEKKKVKETLANGKGNNMMMTYMTTSFKIMEKKLS